jgi:hypothetical protein
MLSSCSARTSSGDGQPKREGHDRHLQLAYHAQLRVQLIVVVERGAQRGAEAGGNRLELAHIGSERSLIDLGRGDEKQVHAYRSVAESAGRFDVGAQLRGASVSGCNEAETTRIGDGRRELGRRGPTSHRRLHDLMGQLGELAWHQLSPVKAVRASSAPLVGAIATSPR